VCVRVCNNVCCAACVAVVLTWLQLRRTSGKMAETTPLLPNPILGPSSTTTDVTAQSLGIRHVTAINLGERGFELPTNIQTFVVGVALWTLCNLIGAVQSIIYFRDDFCSWTDARLYDLYCGRLNDTDTEFYCGALACSEQSRFVDESIFAMKTNGIALILLMIFMIAKSGRIFHSGETYAAGLGALSLVLISTSVVSSHSGSRSRSIWIIVGEFHDISRGGATVLYLITCFQAMRISTACTAGFSLLIFSVGNFLLSLSFVVEFLSVRRDIIDITDPLVIDVGVCTASVGALLSLIAVCLIKCRKSGSLKAGSYATRGLGWLGLMFGLGLSNAMWWTLTCILPARDNYWRGFPDRFGSKMTVGYLAFAAGYWCLTVSLLLVTYQHISTRN
jgi:hypothetical protein